MTNWLPDLGRFDGPRYQAIAEAIALDLRQGLLKPGDRLPTHRDLAYRLGVTVGTVTRGYAEAQRRGLLAAHVGRGSYLAEAAGGNGPLGRAVEARNGDIELGLAFPASQPDSSHFQQTLIEIARDRGVGALLDYQAHGGMAHHRAAGAEWIARQGLTVPPEQVVVTLGAQHGLAIALRRLTEPGDLVLTESLTYSGIKAIAELFKLRLKGVAMDEHGLLPDALEKLCRKEKPRALICIPNLQNPTGAIMPAKRREAIAAIALKHRLPVIEDDAYGFLASERPLLTELLPELGHYVVGTSKSMAPGLRVGFLAFPKDGSVPFLAALRATVWMVPPLAAEVVARWIADGTADALAQSQRESAIERQRLAREMLAGFDYRAHPKSFFGMLHLPTRWRAGDLVAAGARRGIRLRGVDTFAIDGPALNAIRLCVSSAGDMTRLSEGLGRLTALLREGPGNDGFVV